MSKLLYFACLLLALILAPRLCAAQNEDSPVDPSAIHIRELPPLEVYWKERGDDIRLDTVCFNYDIETPEYRGCRKLAAQKFRDECELYTNLYHDSRPYYDKDYKKQSEKYCDAAEHFEP